jgi:hypothetical protein
MAIPISQRMLTALTPELASSAGLRVRIAADSFIPWEWVKFPEPPPTATLPFPQLGPPALVASAALDFFVHGDGRMPAKGSDEVGTKFRTQGVAEVDVIQRPGETVGSLARNQPSKSELRFVGVPGVSGQKVLYGPVKSGPLTSSITASRIDPNSVLVEITVSGSVPWNVAGPQPAIDFKYSVKLAYDRAANKVRWNVKAAHDGFPGHELFIESGGMVRFKKSYLPDWFSPPSIGVAHPSIPQAISGAAALGGVFRPQAWTLGGDFTP